MATSNFFGGQAGKAESAIKGRKDRLDEEERKATGDTSKDSPNKQPDNSNGAQRPPQSKKWYE